MPVRLTITRYSHFGNPDRLDSFLILITRFLVSLSRGWFDFRRTGNDAVSHREHARRDFVLIIIHRQPFSDEGLSVFQFEGGLQIADLMISQGYRDDDDQVLFGAGIRVERIDGTGRERLKDIQ